MGEVVVTAAGTIALEAVAKAHAAGKTYVAKGAALSKLERDGLITKDLDGWWALTADGMDHPIVTAVKAEYDAAGVTKASETTEPAESADWTAGLDAADIAEVILQADHEGLSVPELIATTAEVQAAPAVQATVSEGDTVYRDRDGAQGTVVTLARQSRIDPAAREAFEAAKVEVTTQVTGSTLNARFRGPLSRRKRKATKRSRKQAQGVKTGSVR